MDSVESFARQLFRNDVKSPGSVALDVDVDTQSEFFEVLLLILTYGMKQWYGERINISDVSAEHMILLQKYFLSFGVVLHIDKQDEPAVYSIDNKSYLKKDTLDKMNFTVVAHGLLFTVWFSFMQGVSPKWV